MEYSEYKEFIRNDLAKLDTIIKALLKLKKSHSLSKEDELVLDARMTVLIAQMKKGDEYLNKNKKQQKGMISTAQAEVFMNERRGIMELMALAIKDVTGVEVNLKGN